MIANKTMYELFLCFNPGEIFVKMLLGAKTVQRDLQVLWLIMDYIIMSCYTVLTKHQAV